MIHKSFAEVDGRLVCRVIFSLPDTVWTDRISLVGDFNGWDADAHPFQRTRAGGWFLQLELEPHRAYQFRYRQGVSDWVNDRDADAHVHNIYGSDNSVIITDPEFKPYCDERKILP